MKRYLAIYTGTAEALARWNALPEEQRHARDDRGMQAWNAWGEKHADAIVDQGTPLGKTTRVSQDGVTDIRNQMAAYTIVQAESHDAAAKLFVDHPHFTLFPGDAVEIMECLNLDDIRRSS